ncbi:Glycosyltransferase 28 domain [Modestobacter italicus]|uniref:Glycosyltransferase 28 domain n=1 Tax=Modestobacter italicus (strain DSM 44449 / CECT 9708 / BC 501) TaxID=2732864 RepID=I4ER85_MODI5|nr:glycosyltransferase [Modestobacter marinus]CCH85898.1 Glycosyltransferase 28 domain [Modestobacter marinus]
MTALMVANDGGHLMQLVTLAPRLPVDEDRLWMTVPTAQTRSLLSGQRVHWMAPAPTRDWAAVVRNAWESRQAFKTEDITAVVSTGASLALSVLPMARTHGIPCYYLESATRVHGPSLSGRLLRRVPGISLFTQHESWSDRHWSYGGSVFDGYEGVSLERADDTVALHKVVVSLGTSESFGFRRLVERLLAVLPVDTDVLWQTGSTDVAGLGIDARPRVPAAELFEAMADADVVVAHAGTGSALAALQAGKFPVLVPRRPEHGEHVDDHQLQIAGMLGERGLAATAEVDGVTSDLLLAAAGTRVRRRGDAAPFALV